MRYINNSFYLEFFIEWKYTLRSMLNEFCIESKYTIIFSTIQGFLSLYSLCSTIYSVRYT